MTAHIDLVRHDLVAKISRYLADGSFFTIIGEAGQGKRASMQAALGERRAIFANGNAEIGGFLAGFEELIDEYWLICERKHPEIIARYEQALKRLYPQRQSKCFRVDKDLTQTSGQKERTRFYHHEYQIKLLHSLSEFIQYTLHATGNSTVLVIDNAEKLSPTAISLLRIIIRNDKNIFKHIKIALLCDNECEASLISGENFIRISPLSCEEATRILQTVTPAIPLAEAEMLWLRSRGNITVLNRLLECHIIGLTANGYFDTNTMLDFLLDHYGEDSRTFMLEQFISDHCLNDDPLVRRNYETSPIAKKDELHRAAHQNELSAYVNGEGRLRLVHALSLSDANERLEALCIPGALLKGIGLYDTWLSFFSRWFVDPDARRSRDANDKAAHAFVNVAFVLCSLGMGKISIPFLETFYELYPESRLTPTVIYAQSMTYGRYMIPVDLPRANALAEKNLEIIDRGFRQLDTYEYIKIFAENALAYIRARQGRYDEALALCTNGIERMSNIYGPNKFLLHQSILIYNTAQVYEIIEDYTNAEFFYIKAIKMDPNYGEYYNDLANLIAVIPGREMEALECYQTAIKLCPSYYEAHINRSLLLHRLGEVEKAIKDCKRALDIAPSEMRASLILGSLLLESGAADEACKVLSDGTRYHQSADLFINLTVAQLETQDIGAAYDAALAAVRIAPDRADALNNLAIAAFEHGNPDEALKYAEKAVNLAQSDPDYLQTKNFIADNMGV